MSDWLTEKQLEAVQMVVSQRRGIIWWKVGLGKTRIALEAYVRLTNCRSKLLVVCSPTAFRTWRDEAALHPIFADQIQLEFLSSGILSARLASRQVSQYLYGNIAGIGMIVVDELWMYKRISTKRSKEVRRITERYPTVGLSGSLITNRNIEDIYGQAVAIGLGTQVAKSLTAFRSQFCVSYEDFGLKFAAAKGALGAIQRRLAPFTSIYFPVDTRESKIWRTTIDPTQEQIELFDTCQKDYYANFGNESEVEIKSAAALIVKLQQISDGVVLDDADKRVPVKSSKHDRLMGILEELLDSGQRAIVWFAFKASLEAIYQELGSQACALSSDHVFDSEGWQRGRYKVALATVGSGASLNDFSNVQYAIIYSAPFSYRAVQQAMGRTNRTSSAHQVCYYNFLQTDGSIDKLVYDTLRLTGDIETAAIKSSVDIIKAYMETYGRR